MKKRFRIFLLVFSFLLFSSSILASPALTNLKNNIESRPLCLGYLHTTIVTIANTNGFKNSTFEMFHVPGHFVVKNKSTGQIYDSGDGRGGVIRQHFADCLLHSTDNLFYLESFNGALLYSDFSAKMREDLDMTMFYSFVKLYIFFKSRNNFNNFNRTDLNVILTSYSYYTSSPTLYLNNRALGTTTIPTILAEAGIVGAHTEADFMQMLQYVFTDMKNKMGLPGAFSFEEDTPHLLWVFGGTLGYNELEIKGLLGEYLNRYVKRSLEINLHYIESISSLYVFQERSMQNNLIKISRNENNSNFSLDYGNGKLFKNDRLGYDLSFSYIGEYEFFENIKFGLLFGYEQSTISSSDCEMALKNVMIGGTFKKLYKYDRKSNFNIGIVGNFKINNSGSILIKKDNDINFNNENITLFLQDYRNININTPIISTINISSTFNYTNYNIRNVKLSKNNFNSYYVIANNRYNLFSLNFELDIVKTFKFSETTKSNFTLNARFINYLNKPNNGFKIVNKYYDSVYFMSNSVMETRNHLWFNFKADIQIGKYVEISGIIGTNVMLKKDTFIGAGLMVKF